jgi:hypothetical protein
MIAQLTRNERQHAILISLAVAICGILLGLAGRDHPIGIHGALIFLAGVLMIFRIGKEYFAPEPSDDRLAHYYDDPSKAGIVLSMIWLVIGLAVGDWVAWRLVNPDLAFGGAWSSFGRLRPVHTTSVIFGFGGNGLIATSLYVLQRTSRARLPDQLSPWFVLVGYNLFCVLAVLQNRIRLLPSSREVQRMEAAISWPAQHLAQLPPLLVAVNAVSLAHALGRDVGWVDNKRGGYADTWRQLYDEGCSIIAPGLRACRSPVF